METPTYEESMAQIRQGSKDIKASVQSMANALHTAPTHNSEDFSANPLLRAALANTLSYVGKRIATAMLEFKTSCDFNLSHYTAITAKSKPGDLAPVEKVYFTLPFKELTDEERELPFLVIRASHVTDEVRRIAKSRESFYPPDDLQLLRDIKTFMVTISKGAYDKPQLMPTIAYMVGVACCPIYMTPRPLEMHYRFRPYKLLQVVMYFRPTDDAPWIAVSIDLNIRRVFNLTGKTATNPMAHSTRQTKRRMTR